MRTERLVRQASRWVFVATASATAFLLAEACRLSAGEAMIGAGDLLDAGTVMLGDAATALRDAGAVVRDGGAIGSAQSSPNKNGSRIEVRVPAWKGSDGSEVAFPPTLFDTKRGEPCSIATAADGASRCLPEAALVVPTFFSDAQCERPVLVESVKTTCAATSPRYAKTAVAPGCYTGAFRYYRMSAPRVAAPVYQGSPKSCATVSLTSEYQVRTLDSEISPDEFIEMSTH